MENILEQKRKTPKTREDFLEESERGFVLPPDADREKKIRTEAANKAFQLISHQLIETHNID